MHNLILYIWCFLVLGFIASCTNSRKLKELSGDRVSIEVSMADDTVSPVSVRDSLLEQKPQDKIAIVDIQGEVLIMNAVKDEESGEMVATDRIRAVVVEAKFRNIPERNGYVNIAFEVAVPQTMLSSDWQVRLTPRLYYLDTTHVLDRVYVTGTNYRKTQLRGYELYNRFLNSIIPDSCNFVDTYTYKHLLETFISRNFKDIASLKNDTTVIDSLYAANLFGVTQQEALEHYTKQFLIKRNNRRIGNIDKMYAKYIKTPLGESGIRLDSVIRDSKGTLRYYYVQRVKTQKELRKIDMVIDGEIYKEDKLLYSIPPTNPLTYYISSMTFFADNSVRYIKKIVERNAVANTAAYIDFKVGEYALCDTLHENSTELKRIRDNIGELLSNKDYIVDSLVITASCSPEGSYQSNVILAQNRARAIKEHFAKYIAYYKDSVASSLWDINLTNHNREENKIDLHKFIRTKSIAEYWIKLENLMCSDTNIKDLPGIKKCLLIDDADSRERALSKVTDYPYIRSELYPLLRTVRFDFYLHRKGMIKDTVHTTEVDAYYMSGVQALIDRDYQKAVTVLRSYNDLNSAVAYICMDYNNSALELLETLPKSAKRDYMLAVTYSRLAREDKAVEYFIHAVEQDPSMRHRGNLDPEIALLVKKYNMGSVLDNF